MEQTAKDAPGERGNVGGDEVAPLVLRNDETGSGGLGGVGREVLAGVPYADGASVAEEKIIIMLDRHGRLVGAGRLDRSRAREARGYRPDEPRRRWRPNPPTPCRTADACGREP